EEARERDVGSALAAALLVVDEAAEAHERLLHLLMAVVPLLLAGAEVLDPAVGELLRGVVEPAVLASGQREVVDRGLEEVAGDVAFVVAALRRVPRRAAALSGGARG